MGGATPKFKVEGLHVAVLDPTDGEPTSCGPPEFFRDETAEATRILALDIRKNLEFSHRRLEATFVLRHKLADFYAAPDLGTCLHPHPIGVMPTRTPLLSHSACRGRVLFGKACQV